MKKILKFVLIIPILIGIIIGIIIAIKGNIPDNTEQKAFANMINKLQKKEAQISSIYIYGTSLNIEGTISGISKDNLEGAKLILTNGIDEKEYRLNTTVKDNVLTFKSSQINNMIQLENINEDLYYILLRLKLNNSSNYRFYTFEKTDKNIEYNSFSNKENTYKIKVQTEEKELKKQRTNLLCLEKQLDDVKENEYDIVIDAGHGGKDSGVKSAGYTEANITLDYAEELENYLTENGLKVMMTRTKENSDSFNYVNMYSENGRITKACESKAKYMISLHINTNPQKISGFEIYAPCRCDLSLAEKIAEKIKRETSIEPSNSEIYKKTEGVYVRGFTQKEIEQSEQTAKNNGYEPYPITIDTPYLYTIREVGGIATNAYVDGRNKDYSANKYYQSDHGIECYQIELRIYKNRFR